MRREHFWLNGSRLLGAGLVLIAQAWLCGASAQNMSAGTPIDVKGQFKGKNDKKPRGISGMACLAPKTDGSRECLAVNDEKRFAEIAVLTEKQLAPQDTQDSKVEFVAKNDKGQGVKGTAIDPKCRKDGIVQAPEEFDEFDGEGIAAAGGYLYAASSHSCSGGGKYTPSSYLLVRFRTQDDTRIRGNADPKVERSWRIADMLRNSPVSNDYGKEKKDGTNIEGIAVTDGRLYVGLRTPVTDHAIIGAPVDELFADSTEPLKPASVTAIPVKLGDNTGVRDLAALSDGRLLILAGPSEEQKNVGYKLLLLEKPLEAGKLTPLAVLAPQMTPDGKAIAKAETVTILGETPKLDVIVLYDNIDEGRPMRHQLEIGGAK